MSAGARADLIGDCAKLAAKSDWPAIDAICQSVFSSPDLPGPERADWMRRWAHYMYREGLAGRRIRFGLARSLLSEALPLAAGDHLVEGRILLEETVAHTGDIPRVESSVRCFMRLLRVSPDLGVYAGKILYNLALTYQYTPELAHRAARTYRRAMRHLEGRQMGMALHNYACCCLDIGRLRAARRAAQLAGPLLDPEDRPLTAGLEASLALARREAQHALDIVAAGLADPICGSFASGYLYFYQALAHHALGNSSQALDSIQLAWHHAGKSQNVWVMTRLGTLLRLYNGGAETVTGTM